jgi:hypothetical protein
MEEPEQCCSLLYGGYFSVELFNAVFKTPDHVIPVFACHPSLTLFLCSREEDQKKTN